LIKLFNFLRSIKFAIFLILFISMLSLLSTLIPQGEQAVFYEERYTPFFFFLITKIGFNHFFSSLLFFVPAFLFFINLTLCTITRLTKEIRGKIKKRFGPDILHIGILLLIIGGLTSAFFRQEQFAYLTEKEQIQLLGKYFVTLTRFEDIRYPDGRPKDWISVVNVAENDKLLVTDYSIEVNKPLLFKNVTIYQSSFSDEPFLKVTDAQSASYIWKAGDVLETPQGALMFQSIQQDPADANHLIAVFKAQYTDGTMEFLYKTLSNTIGDYKITELSIRNLSGLTFVVDPGTIPVIIALILIAIGIGLTFIQKIGVKEL